MNLEEAMAIYLYAQMVPSVDLDETDLVYRRACAMIADEAQKAILRFENAALDQPTN